MYIYIYLNILFKIRYRYNLLGINLDKQHMYHQRMVGGNVGWVTYPLGIPSIRKTISLGCFAD